MDVFDGYGVDVDALACAHEEDVLEALGELFKDPLIAPLTMPLEILMT